MPSQREDVRHGAGLFDIRTIIGGLLTFYGVVVLVVGLTSTSHAAIQRSGGSNVNVWTGIGLIVVGLGMIIWARLRPVVVDEAAIEADKRAVEEAAGRGGRP